MTTPRRLDVMVAADLPPHLARCVAPVVSALGALGDPVTGRLLVGVPTILTLAEPRDAIPSALVLTAPKGGRPAGLDRVLADVGALVLLEPAAPSALPRAAAPLPTVRSPLPRPDAGARPDAGPLARRAARAGGAGLAEMLAEPTAPEIVGGEGGLDLARAACAAADGRAVIVDARSPALPWLESMGAVPVGSTLEAVEVARALLAAPTLGRHLAGRARHGLDRFPSATTVAERWLEALLLARDETPRSAPSLRCGRP